MKKSAYAAHAATFSLAAFPSGERTKLEEQIMERAVAHWCKKHAISKIFQAPAAKPQGR